MTEWRTRGEVLDSDDEDVSIGTDSQCPEKPRYSERDVTAISIGEPVRGVLQHVAIPVEEASADASNFRSDEDELALDLETAQRGPKRAKIYGRRTRVPAPTAKNLVAISHSSQSANAASAADRPIAFCAQESQEGQNTSSQAQDYNVASTADEALALCPQAMQGNQNISSLAQEDGHLLSSLDSESLPDMDRLIRGDERLPDEKQLYATNLFDIPDSPLTEPPDSPRPVFRLARQPSQTSAQDERLISGLAHDEPTRIRTDRQLTEELATAFEEGPRRRTRTRTEAQLHPYKLERAKYAAFCKKNGITPVVDPETDRRYQRVMAETQDAGSEADDNETQSTFNRLASSPLMSSSPVRQQSLHVDRIKTAPLLADDDEFPDIDSLLHRDVPGALQTGTKRRKVSYLSTVKDPHGPSQHSTQFPSFGTDSWSMPPSPPPTSSSSDQRRPVSAAQTSGFRLPRGLSPAPLPTPETSSVARRQATKLGDIGLDAHSPPQQSRSSALSRQLSETFNVESSTNSSASEPDLDESQIRRVQKRIKGVLPASWLKIDRHACNPRTLTAMQQHVSSTSPLRTLPQKGVASKITSRRSVTPSTHGALELFDESTDSDIPTRTQVPRFDQTELDFQRKSSGFAHSETIDEDHMEVDWVDPMLPSSLRRTSTLKKKASNKQPRITDALQRVKHVDLSLAGEPPSTMSGGITRRARGKNPKNRPRPRTSHLSAPRLSILDAPIFPSAHTAPFPHFVRLAMRQAKRQPQQGRHSPGRKVIRLSTEQETSDATSTLHDWREGAIAQRKTLVEWDSSQPLAETSSAGPKTGAVFDYEAHRQRLPLQEVCGNAQQQRLPSPLRIEVKDKRGGRGLMRKPLPHQIRLRPIAMRQAIGDGRNDNVRATEPISISNSKFTAVKPTRLRGAQLESLENEYDREHRKAAFERRMHEMTSGLAHSKGLPQSTPFQLSRFMQDDDALAGDWAAKNTEDAHEQIRSRAGIPTTRTFLQRPRKQQPRRLDVEARQYRQPSEPLPILDLTALEKEESVVKTSNVLHGLDSFGARYPTDFDIRPLELGTYFHQSTFIGSGELHDALILGRRDLDVMTGRITIHVEGEVLTWSAWDEHVASGLDRIMSALIALQASCSNPVQHQDQIQDGGQIADYLLRSVVRYCSKCLSFSDPVDRQSCVSRLLRFVNDTAELASDAAQELPVLTDVKTRHLKFPLVLGHQLVQICDHPLVNAETRSKAIEQFRRIATRLAQRLFPACLPEVRSFYEDNRLHSNRDHGVQEKDVVLSTVVALYHVLKRSASIGMSFWQVANSCISNGVDQLRDVCQIDIVWYNIFSILPALEFDSCGVARPGMRYEESVEDWNLVRHLLDRMFKLYPATSVNRGSTINDYVRATMVRCHHLVSRWGWKRCEPMLSAMFDFFARRNLAQLHKEESRRSPRFLSELGKSPSLEVQPEDRAFHLFLKTLAVGLIGMRAQPGYSDKKISGIAWRFIPNHGRTYCKDSEVRQTDLDALRNHHDLLCTLYYASPPNARIRVDLIRNLVDHTSSHREACRLSVRAWSNLASYQTSTDESLDRIDTFSNWFRDILHMTISQYRLARTEAEQQFEAAKALGVSGVTQELLESTVASNQRQISATIVDSMVALKHANECARSWQTVSRLVQTSSFWIVFELFDPQQPRIRSVIDEGLAVYRAVLLVHGKLRMNLHSEQASEESQDYGDSGIFQDILAADSAVASSENNLLDTLFAPLAHLLSNAFGAEICPEEATLLSILNAWVSFAARTVDQGLRDWTSFIDEYSAHSWFQLRDTRQRRTYTDYFLACVVENDGRVFKENRQRVLETWIVSLAARESTLKFQHRLTSSLLNSCEDEPLLENLPFSEDRSTGRVVITWHDLRDRRLGLISSVLANMRRTYDDSMYDRPRMTAEIRRIDQELLKKLMSAMKTNYLELQTPTSVRAHDSADPSVQGAYVVFVQQLVSFLQQYTKDILPVDGFFTDSAAFPLPAGDPTYVVGRLKGYVPRLDQSSTRKKLVYFVHSIIDRAAVDGQQHYLVSQLYTAMSGEYERGSAASPSLRHVLMTAVLPAYIAASLSSSCAWILSVPILQASKLVVEGLMYDFSVSDNSSVTATTNILESLMCSLQQPVDHTLRHPGLVQLAHVQKVLTAVFDVAASSVTLIDYIFRATGSAGAVWRFIAYLNVCAHYMMAVLHHSLHAAVPIADDIGLQPSAKWHETAELSKSQLKDELEKTWSAQNGQYRVRRGNVWKEINVSLGESGEEKDALLEAMARLQHCYGRVQRRRTRRLALPSTSGLADIVV